MLKFLSSFLLVAAIALACHNKPKPVAEQPIKVNTTPTPTKAKARPQPKQPVKDAIPTYTRSIYRQYITPQIADLLAQHLPGWQLPDPSGWNKIWFHEYKSDTSLVNYAPADFNGDHRPDYAFILQNAKKGFAVWVLQSEGNAYRSIKLTQTFEGTQSIEMGLAITPPGKMSYIDAVSGDVSTRVLRYPGISTLWFETSAQTFYWENGRYRSVITGD